MAETTPDLAQEYVGDIALVALAAALGHRDPVTAAVEVADRSHCRIQGDVRTLRDIVRHLDIRGRTPVESVDDMLARNEVELHAVRMVNADLERQLAEARATIANWEYAPGPSERLAEAQEENERLRERVEELRSWAEDLNHEIDAETSRPLCGRIHPEQDIFCGRVIDHPDIDGVVTHRSGAVTWLEAAVGGPEATAGGPSVWPTITLTVPVNVRSHDGGATWEIS